MPLPSSVQHDWWQNIDKLSLLSEKWNLVRENETWFDKTHSILSPRHVLWWDKLCWCMCGTPRTQQLIWLFRAPQCRSVCRKIENRARRFQILSSEKSQLCSLSGCYLHKSCPTLGILVCTWLYAITSRLGNQSGKPIWCLSTGSRRLKECSIECKTNLWDHT